VRLGPDIEADASPCARGAAAPSGGFFHGQRLDDAGQVGFTRRLGDITLSHPTQRALEGQPHVHELDAAQGHRDRLWPA